jgi:hypothetical protein
MAEVDLVPLDAVFEILQPVGVETGCAGCSGPVPLRFARACGGIRTLDPMIMWPATCSPTTLIRAQNRIGLATVSSDNNDRAIANGKSCAE